MSRLNKFLNDKHTLEIKVQIKLSKTKTFFLKLLQTVHLVYVTETFTIANSKDML